MSFINDPQFLDQAALKMKEAGVKPEVEIFDLGMMITTLRMRKEGKLADPLHFQFVMGSPWGAPATPKAFLHIHDYLPPNATWSNIGIGPGQMPMAMMALIMGGHIRVGMEDSIYVRRGELAKSNAQLVERVVRLCPRIRTAAGLPRRGANDIGFEKNEADKPCCFREKVMNLGAFLCHCFSSVRRPLNIARTMRAPHAIE